MRTEILSTAKGDLSLLSLEREEKLETISLFTDAIMSAPTETVVLEKAAFPSAFFDLKTRFAGECLQKVSNHRMRLVILGDFQNLESNALRDFVVESNRRGQVVFAQDLERAITLLK